jgi:2-isopropylmalate synthase
MMMERVFIFDTTLRDGEQSPGASMTVEEKCEIANQLARLGVDVIEAGFPVSSPVQFEGCRLIAGKLKGVTVAALARALQKDIDSAYNSIKQAESPRIHTFLASSPIHMEYKLKKNPDEVYEMAVSAVKYARSLVPQVEFSPEDATRSEMPFLIKLIEGVIDAGATVINIPDTVGYAIPSEFGTFIATIMSGVKNMHKAIISVHCHNDLGLAVSNSIAAVQNGARQVEVALNGIGERAGNAALEEFAMCLHVRKDLLGFETGINTKQIYQSSKMLFNIIAFPMPRNKPIVGENAFAHESGIHQDGVLKKRETYEIMTPESVGRDTSAIILGRHSGMHGFKKRVAELGFGLSEEELAKVFDRFLKIADMKKEVYDDDLFIIVAEELGHKMDTFSLDYFHVESGNKETPVAKVKVKEGEKAREEKGSGDGPVDAVFNAIDKATGLNAKLVNFAIKAVTPDKKAIGEVTVTLDIGEVRCSGKGSSTDILEASALAYLSALNRFKAIKTAINNGSKKNSRNGGN